MTLKWRLWGTFGAALDGFWTHFACSDVTWQSLFRLFVESWATLCRKIGLRDFDATLEQKLSLCRSWRARWSHLGQKSHQKSVGMAKSCLEGASRSKVWRVSARCSVGVMRTAGNGRDSAENQVKSEVKACLSDKSYD